MRSKEEFKKRFENGEFTEELSNANSLEEIVKVARELGYDLNVEDVLSAELNEEMIAAIAGGKGDTYSDNSIHHDNIIKGNNNTQLTF